MCFPLDVRAPGFSQGRRAEDLAAAYLLLPGLELLERNFRDGPRENDLIARQGAWRVVVEVRFRGRIDRGRPEESVDAGKRRHLLRAGRNYWLRHGRAVGRLRFDLIALHLTRDGLTLRHYPHFLIPSS